MYIGEHRNKGISLYQYCLSPNININVWS